MRILMLDLDTLRPDHLGCYGYHRNTSPAIDSVAEEGMRFDNYYCADSPCLPSRAGLVTGMFGLHNGAVNHGGLAADMRLYGANRDFHDPIMENNLFFNFRKAGFHTASISSFAERHSSYWFNAGFHEVFNCGKRGGESAEDVMPTAMDWLNKNGEGDQWFLHINMWDPHTPYRAPKDFGNPFEHEPMPNWITEDVLKEHLQHVGPHSLHELGMYNDIESKEYPRQLGKAGTMEEVKAVFDGYDCGIRYMDDQIQRLVNFLKEKGIYEDTAIIITSDHGENMGELGIYSEHATADAITPHIPMIVKWPNMQIGVDKSFHYNVDLLPTMAELLGISPWCQWDGKSYAETLLTGAKTGHPYLVLSQCAHVCQRSVRFGDYIYIRTYHDGYHLFPTEMVFDLKNDPYEQHNLAETRLDLCGIGCRYLISWQQENMTKSRSEIDPLWTVLHEGGPYHAKGNLPSYYERLCKTGREDGAKELKRRHPREFDSLYSKLT